MEAQQKMNTKSRQPLSFRKTLNRPSGQENACMILSFVSGSINGSQKFVRVCPSRISLKYYSTEKVKSIQLFLKTGF